MSITRKKPVQLTETRRNWDLSSWQMSCNRLTHESDKSNPWPVGKLVCATGLEPTNDQERPALPVNKDGNRRNILQMTVKELFFVFIITFITYVMKLCFSWRFVSWRLFSQLPLENSWKHQRSTSIFFIVCKFGYRQALDYSLSHSKI